MHLQKSLLLFALTDCAPLHLLSRDKWGWGKSGFYSVAQGYNALQPPQASKETTTLWKQVWDPLGLPKVNFFSWVLMHGKILTGENLAKRGFIGAHRYPMCCQALEMMDHLFVDRPSRKKYGKYPFKASMPQPQDKSQWLNYFPHGRCDTLMTFKAIQPGEEFGKPSPNIFVGNYGWLETIRSSTTCPLPPQKKLLFSSKKRNGLEPSPSET